MKKRNLYFGFGPSKGKGTKLTLYRRPKGPANRPAKSGSARPASRGEGRADLVSALVNLGYTQAAAHKAAAAAKGSDFDSLFRDALKRVNPMQRTFPAVSPAAERALRKLARSRMPKKSKKKKRSRKGKMPAGLRKYWARKRAAKARRKKKNSSRPRRRRRAVKPFTPRRRKATAKRNTRRRRARKPARRRVVRPPFKMTPKQLQKYKRALARATGKRIVVI